MPLGCEIHGRCFGRGFVTVTVLFFRFLSEMRETVF
jgi:hypothetical protein